MVAYGLRPCSGTVERRLQLNLLNLLRDGNGDGNRGELW